MPNNIKAISLDFDGVMDIVDRIMPKSTEKKIGSGFEYEFIPTHHSEQECKQWLQSVYTLALFGKPKNGTVRLKKSFGIYKEPTPVNLSQQQLLEDFPFLAEIKAAIEKKEDLALYCGSNRQTDTIDSDIQKSKYQALSANESLGLLVGVIQNNGVTIAHNEKADIRLQGPEGGMNEKYQFADDVKLMTLLKQMHALARDNPNDRLTYTFMDDREDIINRLEDILRKNPELIPSNMQVSLIRSESLTPDERIKNEGKIVCERKEVITGTGETLSAERINDASKELSDLMQDQADKEYNIFPYKPLPKKSKWFTEAQKIERNELIEKQAMLYLGAIKDCTIHYTDDKEVRTKYRGDIKELMRKTWVRKLGESNKRWWIKVLAPEHTRKKEIRVQNLMNKIESHFERGVSVDQMKANISKLTELTKERKGLLWRTIHPSTKSISKGIDKYIKDQEDNKPKKQ